MKLPDVNICIAAFRQDHQDHAISTAWLQRTYSADSHVGISPQVLSSMIRIVTQPGFMAGFPSLLTDALAFGQSLVDNPKTVLVGASVSWWSHFCHLSQASQAKGKLVADVWLAAMAVEHNCTWVSNDSDFAKFPGLKWQRP
ncbi:MAG: TA system VapC family ribonuclease toxin [Roseimicrobium sp.]